MIPALAGSSSTSLSYRRDTLLPDAFGLPDPALIDYLPFATNMFLHGGWLHLIVNMWTLWLFGPAIEDRFGPSRYFMFYLVCGVIASADAKLDQARTVPHSDA